MPWKPKFQSYLVQNLMQSIPHPNDASNKMVTIGPLVTEIFKFENVYRHTHRQTTARLVYYKPKTKESCPCSSHYGNTPMYYTEIFQGCKNYNFQMKTGYIFLIFAQNIDCGYTLEPHNLCFRAKLRKKVYTPVNPSFTI